MEPVNEVIKYVKCVDVSYASGLSVGEVYPVVEQAKWYYWILVDGVVSGMWSKRRFVDIEEVADIEEEADIEAEEARMSPEALDGPENFPEDQTQKADGGKHNPQLVEVDLIDANAALLAVLEYGVAKYGERGGWKQVDMVRYDAAGRRHRIAQDRGELFDEESGLLHMAHEAANLMFRLQTFIEENPTVDFTKFNTPPKLG